MLEGVSVPSGDRLIDHAARGAREGRHGAGTVLHRVGKSRAGLAIVLEPEVPPARAAHMLLVGQRAFAEAVSALSPPETTLACLWGGEVMLNGASFALLDASMGKGPDDAPPDWLVVETSFRIAGEEDPGRHPDRTSLVEEMGDAVSPSAVIEATARQWLRHIHLWETEGFATIARGWLSLAADADRQSEALGARWLGLDDEGAALVETRDGVVAQSLLSRCRR